ncbi:MAG: hypothetical protein NVS2B9_06850 [Myxococcales bacterium]
MPDSAVEGEGGTMKEPVIPAHLQALALMLVAACTTSPETEKPQLQKPASAASSASFGDLRPEPDSEEELQGASPSPGATLAAPPIDSDRASVFRGGGCYPPGIRTAGLDQLILIDPEWSPAVGGTAIESAPVLVHGTVVDAHGDRGGDFPATHLQNDQNTFLRLDPADSGRLATGNRDGLLALEWEVGALPDWAWPSRGDRVVALGRWIFDCGHPDPVVGSCSTRPEQPCLLDSDCGAGAATCNGVRFNYKTEIHPPQAMAVVRRARGGLLVPLPGEEEIDEEQGEGPLQLVTRADVLVSAAGGAAGDGCVLTHRDSVDAILGTNCFPLSNPIAHLDDADFSFELPLPPRGRHASAPIWRIDARTTPGVAGRTPVPAEVAVVPLLESGEPRLSVTVRMAHATRLGMPTGFAASIVAGWSRPREVELRHVRVVIEGLVVRNPLKPDVPVAGRDVPGWRAQVAVDGDWRQLSGLETISAGDEGRLFGPRSPLVADVFLEKGASLRVQADGTSSACVDTLFGQSLGTSLYLFGFDLGAAMTCLNAVDKDPGKVEVSFPWPRFGARADAYETASVGGDGLTCSGARARACTADADCAAGERCAGAFALRYRIEEVEEVR